MDGAHIRAPCTYRCTSCRPGLPELPPARWVHCEAGYRACIAASFLDAAGRAVIAVDDDFQRAAPPACRSTATWHAAAK